MCFSSVTGAVSQMWAKAFGQRALHDPKAVNSAQAGAWPPCCSRGHARPRPLRVAPAPSPRSLRKPPTASLVAPTSATSARTPFLRPRRSRRGSAHSTLANRFKCTVKQKVKNPNYSHICMNSCMTCSILRLVCDIWCTISYCFIKDCSDHLGLDFKVPMHYV